MRKKVLFVLPHLKGGGAERVILTVLRYLDRAKYDISLAVVHFEGQYKDQLPRDIQVFDLGAKRVRNMLVPFMKLAWDLKPDTIFSTLGYLNIALIMLRPLLNKKVKLIVREGSIVSQSIKTSKYPFLWPILYRKMYKKADLIICQSQYMQQDLEQHFQIPNQKITQIYNPVDFELILNKADSEGSPFIHSKSGTNIVAVGRLHNEKGYSRLIQSMPELLKLKPDAMLWILGIGPLEQKLQTECETLGIKDHVVFMGFQPNPYRWLKNADLFILSSYYEGLPNVLLEAIAVGCPVLAVDHPGGTREIMELTGQSDRIVEKLNWREEWFERPKPKAIESLKEYFEACKIIKQYSSVI